VPAAATSGIAAGLFVSARLPGVDVDELAAAAAARGVGLTIEGSLLLLGFANVSEPAIAAGLRALAEAITEL
jgi:DNA-binding transcriptional MocR family regulator